VAYWVYENTVHKKARVHSAECSFCGDGRGLHGGGKTLSGNWYGPFPEIETAMTTAFETKQSDVRGCNLCVGSIVPIIPSIISLHDSTGKPATAIELPADWEQQRELKCSLAMMWILKGRLSLDSNNRVVFPSVEAVSGLYRLAARYPDGRLANYIGESDNLRRRFGNYRNPGPTQQTSLRINAWLKELIDDGGEVLISVAQSADFNGTAADMSIKPTRRMFEQMAIVLEHADDVESLNR
jgi:hypothetical protein